MKSKRIELFTGKQKSNAVLLVPSNPKALAILLAHGAGNNMDSPFMNFFQERFAKAGYPCLKFNFPYMEARRKVPDRKEVLLSCFEQAMAATARDNLIIGGKSMGGRMASYLADRPIVKGLFFLGYPLHPPGKIEELRDQHLYSIRKPMFFASGTHDPFARYDLLQKTVSRISGAKLFSIEGAGHSLELPKRSEGASKTLDSAAEALIEWLNKTF